jgi:hypothetical protein
MSIYEVRSLADNSQRLQRVRRASDFNHKVMELVGDDWGGNAGVPGDNTALYVQWSDITHVYSIGEDGSTLWVGYPDEWLWHMPMSEARRLAWFILRDHWAKREWFGLRRKAFYWALHRAVRPTSRGR